MVPNQALDIDSFFGRAFSASQLLESLRVADRRVDVASLARPVRRDEGHAPRGRRGKLLTPNRKRSATVMLRERFGVSERRACRVVGQHRSTQRLEPPVVDDDEQQLRGFLRDFSVRRPRWGWRRVAKREGGCGVTRA